MSILCQRNGSQGVGDYLEFGVFNGTSLVCMDGALRRLGLDRVRLFGFDSFEGLPHDASNAEEGGLWHAGQFASSYHFTQMVLRYEGVRPERAQLIPGWFDQTLTKETAEMLDLKAAGVIMIDCDLYASTKVALRFAAPLIPEAAILVFDDWHSGEMAKRGLGERRAFDDFLGEHPEFSATPLKDLCYADNAEVFLVERRTE